MKDNYAYIAMLIDRSGSMSTTVNDVIGGVNTFLDDQEKLPGDVTVTIATFDDKFEIVRDALPLKRVSPIMLSDVAPRGSTALADAAMRLINHVGAKLSAMPEYERPSQVMFLVFSDGEENSSRETTLAMVREAVERQTKDYNWKFLFFGMDIDANKVGAGIGVRGLGASKSAGGAKRMIRAASAYAGYTRLGQHDKSELLASAHHVDDNLARGATEDFEDLLKKPTSSSADEG